MADETMESKTSLKTNATEEAFGGGRTRLGRERGSIVDEQPIVSPPRKGQELLTSRPSRWEGEDQKDGLKGGFLDHL